MHTRNVKGAIFINLEIMKPLLTFSIAIIFASCGQINPTSPDDSTTGSESRELSPEVIEMTIAMSSTSADYSGTEDSVKIVQSYFNELAKKHPDGIPCWSGYSDSAEDEMYKYRYDPGNFQGAIKLRSYEGKPDKIVGTLSAEDMIVISQSKAFTVLVEGFDDSAGLSLELPPNNGDDYKHIFLDVRPSCMGVVGIYMSETAEAPSQIVGAVKNKRLWLKLFRMMCGRGVKSE